MKNLIFILGLFVSCSQAQTTYYQLADQGPDKDFLRQTIEAYRQKGFNYERPSLVIDGRLFEGKDLNAMSQLKLKKCELVKIYFLSPISAKNIYGQRGEGGIVLIQTKKCDDHTELTIMDNLDFKG